MLRDALADLPHEALPRPGGLHARGGAVRCSSSRGAWRRSPSRRRSPARCWACCSSTPRCARSPHSRSGWRGSAAAPSSSPRARARWQLETRSGVVMDGAAAEHVREGIPVLASYCDALGIRAFADGKDLAADLAETDFQRHGGARRQAAHQPRVRGEPSVPGARGLEDDGRSRRCRAAASSCSPGRITRAPCRWRCRPPRCTWRPCAAWKSSCCGRKASRCPRRSWTRRAAAAAASGGSVRETSDRDEALERRAGAVREGMGRHAGTTAMRPRTRGCAPASATGACAGDWFARAPRLPPHALPAGAAQYRGRRRGARRPAQRRAARGLQPPARADGRAVPDAQGPDAEEARMIMHRSDQTLAIRALRSAAPYIRMYKGKTFVVKAGGGVFADTDRDARAGRADRDPALLRRARRAGARRRPAADRAREGARACRRAWWRAGASRTRSPST